MRSSVPPTFDAEQVLARVLDRDQEAWNQFVRQYERLVWSVVARSFVKEAEREDVSQLVFLRLAERLHTVEDPKKLTAFVGSLAKFTAWEAYRRHGRQPPPVEAAADQASGEDVSDESVRRGQAQTVVAALRELSEQCQQLLRLFFGAELSTREVAVQLDLEEGTARVQKSRCLAELRKVNEVRRLLDVEER